MKTMRRMARIMSAVLVIAIATLGVQVHANAGLIGAETVITTEQAQFERSAVLAAFDRTDVREQLIAFGVDPDEARDRVSGLSDSEISRMAGQLEQLPAGGVGSVVGALVFIFIVLLITDILGFTDVFPFVKKTVN